MTSSETKTTALHRKSFTICLAEILKVDVDDLPEPSGDGDRVKIGYWLAARNLALVPVRNPSDFQWAGWWIGLLADGDGYVVMAGTPSGVAWVPDGVFGGAGKVVEGWVVAPPALTLITKETSPGTVEAIYRYPDSGAPGESLRSARLIAGVGLEGDRYALGRGHFQSEGRWGQALTFIAAEAIEALVAEHGIDLAPLATRRNILTRGIDLNSLIGKRFRVGGILCQGSRLAEPCAWLQNTTPPGTLRGLVHRGGLRADITENGTVHLGDRIEPVLE